MLLVPCAKQLVWAIACTKSKNVDNTCVRHLKTRQLIFSEYGEPAKVLKCQMVTIGNLNRQDVLVRMIAAPINPADINAIQGTYPIKVDLPTVPGNEGLGIIEDVGVEVGHLRPGQKVIFTRPAVGTWRDYAAMHMSCVRAIPNCFGTAEGAMLAVNTCTAYRLLSDFIPVRECKGVVIMNGGNSAVAQYAIQFCKEWCVPLICVVRDRPNIDDLKHYLLCLGATCVLTEEELAKTQIFNEGKIERPVLALNSIGGKQLFNIAKHLQYGAMMVTYGGMAKSPVMMPTSAFIFKNISMYGYWMTQWNMCATEKAKDCMLNEIITMICEKRLRAPMHKMIKFENFKEAIEKSHTAKGFNNFKYVFDFAT